MKNDSPVFAGWLKQHWTQNFLSLTQKTKICNIMVPSFSPDFCDLYIVIGG